MTAFDIKSNNDCMAFYYFRFEKGSREKDRYVARSFNMGCKGECPLFLLLSLTKITAREAT